MTHSSKLAVNVFGEEKKQDEGVQQQNAQRQTAQPEDKTPSSTGQETGTTNTQVTASQDDGAAMQNALSISTPWIAAGVVAIVILIALFTIIRKLNRKG